MKRLKRAKPQKKFSARFKVGAGGCGCYGPGVRHGDPQRPLLKTSPRSAGRATLETQVLAWLANRVHEARKRNPDTPNIMFHKERIAVDLRTKESLVEIVLRRLNQTGLIYQPRHAPDMDCHRNRFYGLGGFDSMWEGDRYYIRHDRIDEVLAHGQ